jgi:hypothetical protein
VLIFVVAKNTLENSFDVIVSPVKDPRRNSFEISDPDSGKVLFSKLQTGTFPDLDDVLTTITSFSSY